jgi:pyridinium-3,5-bisthiocarboxylic acid mononucleotide nickel chelatase
MVLGALLDLGLPLGDLRAALGSLAIEVGSISSERVLRAGVSATRFRASAGEPIPPGDDPDRQHDAPAEPRPHTHEGGRHDRSAAGAAVHHHHGPGVAHAHHSLKTIAAAIGRSALSPAGRDRAIHLFERLAEAEAAIHAVPIERVHLHEVGALDSIVDIVGAVFGMEWLGADEVLASPLNVGSGTVKCAHGTYPVPAPATASLLKGTPVYAGAIASELVTPTGALLVTGYATRFGTLPPIRMTAIGYGAGARDFAGHPNVLRLIVGESDASAGPERILSLECEIDDMNPQLFGPLMDRLYAAGALDVFYVPVQMKKNRPGTLVSVIAPPERRDAITAVLFSDSTTIGVRYQEMLRDRLDRRVESVDTPFGPIRIKVASKDGRVLNASPEFDDCTRAAAEHGASIKDVQAAAVKGWIEKA